MKELEHEIISKQEFEKYLIYSSEIQSFDSNPIHQKFSKILLMVDFHEF